MPNYDIYDVFCFTGTINDPVDINNAALLDPVTLTASDNGSGTPVLAAGDTFNGETITQSGIFISNAVYSDGSAGVANGDYIMTDAGNNYIVFNDSHGDFEICDLEITEYSIGRPERPHEMSDVLNDDEVTNCVCFASTMPIDTDRGPIPAGQLKIGDMVKTLDKGFQPVEFIYKREVPATASNTPILFKKGVIGNTDDLLVSQKHRIYTGTLPAYVIKQLQGKNDHLLHADKFINGTTVRLCPEVKSVEYVHLMFADHELVYCNGTISESWQPTRKALKHAPEVEDELLSIFPEIGTRKAIDPGCMVRPELLLTLKSA